MRYDEVVGRHSTEGAGTHSRSQVHVSGTDRARARRWSRTISGQTFGFTVVDMPGGEIRWAVRKFHGGGDPRFDCYWSGPRLWTFRPPVTLTLRIENRYELHPDVTTEVVVTVPSPPPVSAADAYEAWADEFIYAETGTGSKDGLSWYDVEIISSSDHSLIGRTFEWGY